MPALFAWSLWSAAALAAAAWSWLNIPRYSKLLRHRLRQPGEPTAPPPGPPPGPGTGTSVPVPASPPHPPPHHPPTGTEGPVPDRDFPGGVAILSPGRDEAEHLPTVLPELCDQDHPQHLVVFIDDASSDATPRITADLAARFDNLLVVRNDQPPPPGWMGKCWAIHRGYEALQAWEADRSRIDRNPGGETPATPPPPSATSHPPTEITWLCFTDADIHWHPLLLSRAIEYCQLHDADLLGVAPTLRFGSRVESLVQLQLVLALGLMLPYDSVVHPDSPRALTGGAFILVRRSFYDQIGGHTAVKGEMVEDLKLGMALKAAGARHRAALAGDLQWCRMYDSPADLWEGLTKNAYAGFGHRWWLALPACGLLLIVNVLPPVYFLLSLAWLILSPMGDAPLDWRPPTALLFSIIALLGQAAALNKARRLTAAVPDAYCWTMPLGSAIYLAIILASAWQYHTTGNTWKGRSYSASDETA